MCGYDPDYNESHEYIKVNEYKENQNDAIRKEKNEYPLTRVHFRHEIRQNS